MLRAVGPMSGPEEPMGLGRLRSRAAVVRALLDELERIWTVPRPSPREELVFGEQLIEELARLGCQIVECASTLSLAHARASATLTTAQVASSDRRSGAIGDDADAKPSNEGK